MDYPGWFGEADYQLMRYAIPDDGPGYPHADLDNPGFHDLLVGMHGPDDYPRCPGSFQHDRPGFPKTDRCNYSLGVDIVRQRLYNQNA